MKFYLKIIMTVPLRCVRNINTTHNYLYCEYVTGMVTYFDLQVDPHQLRNVLHTLTDLEVNYMHSQVVFIVILSVIYIFLLFSTLSDLFICCWQLFIFFFIFHLFFLFILFSELFSSTYLFIFLRIRLLNFQSCLSSI